MITFRGVRKDDHTAVVMYQDGENGKPTILDPAPSLLLANHSPDGFEWGYLGSGPAQLALALLFHSTGDAVKTREYYQRFKEEYVACWGRRWEITEATIKAWLNARVLEDEVGAIVEGVE